MTAATKPPTRKTRKRMREIPTIRARWANDPKRMAAWSVGDRVAPSAWAQSHRVLSEKESAEPGNWSNARTPYLAGIMDTIGNPDITDVVVMKAAQVGMSEAIRNVLGYWIDQDPGPVLAVMPDEDSAKEILGEKFAPLIRSTPACAAHLTPKQSDVGKRRILLDNMEIHAAWSGSPQSLASRPKRYLIYDEVDKYPAWSGRESDPISLGNKRRTTYGHRGKSIYNGTPTTRIAPMWKLWDSSPVQLRFRIPCPSCGVFNAPAWSNIRWPEAGAEESRAEHAARIDEGGLAWYQCPGCNAEIRERQRAAMLRKGKWAPDGHEVDAEGPSVQGIPAGTRKVAFHVPATISPWVSWSQMASEFVGAVGDEMRMMDWRNSRLGEPFEIRAAALKSGAFDEKIAAGHKPGLIPPWAGMLLASADTQKDGFWWVVRAWGHGFRSRLIAHGHAATLDEVRERTIDASYTWDGVALDPLRPQLLAIDSGGGTEIENSDQNRTDQVYQFALSDPARIYAIKGFGGRRQLEVPIRQSFISYSIPGDTAPSRVALYHLNTGYFKDVLAARIAAEAKAPDAWELHSKVDDDYVRQMTSEHKVILRKGRAQEARWVLVTPGAANHLFDAEVYNLAAAQIAHVELLPTADKLAAQRRIDAMPQDTTRDRDAWDSATGWR